jgi:hypothetical protein
VPHARAKLAHEHRRGDHGILEKGKKVLISHVQ